jgi:sterol desaturase/sphingolipid hydroxylase (fatty acid hydroxylase superfamily)
MEYIVAFFAWTFCLYWIHRTGHRTPYVKTAHLDHHKFININGKTTWHWNNLFLFNDTWTSTADLWITEVIPTLIFSWITGHWWLSVFYYLWAALIQEVIEHNPKFSLYPFLTSGKWHLVHHRDPSKNFGLFTPVWDIVFKTYKPYTN